MKVLVIGDCHIDEHQPLDRFSYLGNLIATEQPEYVVFIGDVLTLHCFSAWDKDKRKKMEGVRRSNEIDAANTALDLMFEPIKALQKTQRKARKKAYQPKLIYIEGNHENREERYLDYYPELIGTVDYKKDLDLKGRGFVFVPYKDYYFIDGVGFTHIPMTKAGKGISSAQYMQQSLHLHAHSVVFGHTHELRTQGEHRHGAAHFNQSLNCGCFFEHVDDYAKGAKTDYWRGVIMLDIYDTNRFDFRTISMCSLRRNYGS